MFHNKNIITDGNTVVQSRHSISTSHIRILSVSLLSESTFLLFSRDFSQRPTVEIDGKIFCPEINILLPDKYFVKNIMAEIKTCNVGYGFRAAVSTTIHHKSDINKVNQCHNL